MKRKRKGIDINGQVYKAGELRLKVKTLLNTAKRGVILPPAENTFMDAVLRRSPEYDFSEAQLNQRDELIISIRASLLKTHCFQFRKQDGGWERVGYELCCRLNPKPTSALAKFKASARSAVENDIWAFKRVMLATHPKCRHTGVPITAETSHVHHAEVPFSKIVGRFIQEYQIDVNALEYNGEELWLFCDQSIAEKFREYHNKFATLELIHQDVHHQLHAKKS